MATTSVIIAAYNYGRFLGECLESALGQTRAPLEVIVVDDGSTDDTPQVVAVFGDRVRYLRQRNAGPAAARNRGIEAARGDYLAFLDADDTWPPDSLERRAAALDRHPEVGLVFADARVFDASGTVEPSLLATKRHYARLRRRPLGDDAWVLEGDVFGALIQDRFITVPTAIVRRSELERVGRFDESLRAQEDWDLWVRMVGRVAMACVERPLANVRLHEANLTWHGMLIARTHLEFIRRLLAQAGSRRWLLRQRLGLYLFDLGYLYFSGGAHAEARRAFAEGALCRPHDWRMWAYGAASLLPAPAAARLRGWKRRAAAWRVKWSAKRATA